MSPPPLPPDPYGASYPAMPGGGRAGLRAAVAVWVTAGLLLLFSTCCVGSIGMMGLLPMDQLRQADQSGQVPSEMWDEVAKVHAYLPAIAAVLALFTVVPSIVLLVLGFAVKKGKRGATMTALILSGVALLGVGLIVLMSLLGSITSGQFDLCGLMPILVMAGCLVWCVMSLYKALGETDRGYAGDVFQPMHQHPTPGNPGSSGQYRRSLDDDPWENSL